MQSIEAVAIALGRSVPEIENAIIGAGYISSGVIGPAMFAMLREHFGPPPEPEQIEPTSGQVTIFQSPATVRCKLVTE
jgi:hypothetical protein